MLIVIGQNRASLFPFEALRLPLAGRSLCLWVLRPKQGSGTFAGTAVEGVLSCDPVSRSRIRNE